MAKSLPTKVINVIIIGAFAVGWAPAFGQEGETTGGGGAEIKEEAGVEAKRTETGEYIFREVVIEGRLERPVALFIKRQQPEFKSVRFARDFWDDILRPIDKEEFEKAFKETRFDYVKNPLLWMAVATASTAGAVAGYQAYNEEWAQVKVYGISAGAAAATAVVLVLIDRGRARAAK
ncbi:MAG: hypothetical protein GTN49_10990 [candidate division Zixibacteria bacterium]|nr:hypothetical protein [candidate division Zixibacteria bacterium]